MTARPRASCARFDCGGCPCLRDPVPQRLSPPETQSLLDMAYFKDLSPYTYDERKHLELQGLIAPDQEVVNVGWLAWFRWFPRAKPRAEFLEALRVHCEQPAIRHRGFHTCLLHGARGNGVILVRGRQRIYAAPDMILHYVRWHRYRPPAEFVEAVMAGPG